MPPSATLPQSRSLSDIFSGTGRSPSGRTPPGSAGRARPGGRSVETRRESAAPASEPGRMPASSAAASASGTCPVAALPRNPASDAKKMITMLLPIAIRSGTRSSATAIGIRMNEPALPDEAAEQADPQGDATAAGVENEPGAYPTPPSFGCGSRMRTAAASDSSRKRPRRNRWLNHLDPAPPASAAAKMTPPITAARRRSTLPSASARHRRRGSRRAPGRSSGRRRRASRAAPARRAPAGRAAAAR